VSNFEPEPVWSSPKPEDPERKHMHPVLKRNLAWFASGLAAIAAVTLLIVALIFIGGAVTRYQARANAKNQAITAEKQVRIAILHARARYRESIGIKKAQREINKTLTPIYVSFELTQAMQAIATSGKNNSIIYIPTSPQSGLPIVPTSNSVTPIK
jgi:hypothetical protein